MCNPVGVQELPVLSPTDISKSTTGWECRPLTVEEVLREGERFAYYYFRVLHWLGEL